MLGYNQLPICELSSFQLHHDGHSLLLKILKNVSKWVLHLIHLLGQHQKAFVQLQFQICDSFCLLLATLIRLEFDVFELYVLWLDCVQHGGPLLNKQIDLRLSILNFILEAYDLLWVVVNALLESVYRLLGWTVKQPDVYLKLIQLRFESIVVLLCTVHIL